MDSGKRAKTIIFRESPEYVWSLRRADWNRRAKGRRGHRRLPTIHGDNWEEEGDEVFFECQRYDDGDTHDDPMDWELLPEIVEHVPPTPTIQQASLTSVSIAVPKYIVELNGKRRRIGEPLSAPASAPAAAVVLYVTESNGKRRRVGEPSFAPESTVPIPSAVTETAIVVYVPPRKMVPISSGRGTRRYPG